MELSDFDDLEWLDPWFAWHHPNLEAELAREVGPGHPLYEVQAISVGMRSGSDDVLFFLPDHTPPLAAVHLTWIMKQELSPHWPGCSLYRSIADWVERCMKPDHQDFDDDT